MYMHAGGENNGMLNVCILSKVEQVLHLHVDKCECLHIHVYMYDVYTCMPVFPCSFWSCILRFAQALNTWSTVIFWNEMTCQLLINNTIRLCMALTADHF